MFIYPLVIAFILVFISELGDKTQLLVLSFSSKLHTSTILLGVALGSFLSHGLAIIFGSILGNIENAFLHSLLEIITYTSFLIFGFITLFSHKNNNTENKSLLSKHMSNLSLNYILIIAFSIAIGELGDKTFLASIGLGIQYPSQKILLIIGAILGMVISDLFAILLGKFLTKKLPENILEKFSGILFLIFGFIGFINILF